MVFVTKADGNRQQFDKEKVVRTCLKMHATPLQAGNVAHQIESRLYEGMPTHDILQMIFQYLGEHMPELKQQIDLREAIVRLRPKPDFEKFVGMLLQEFGYRVFMNQIIPGKCVSHEIDAVAVNGDEVIYVEVKHHLQYHTFTGLGVFLEANSTFEDLKEGYKLGKHRFNFTKAMVVCNTKISDHAKHYAQCQGISYIGWNAPEQGGLERMIEDKKLYPITVLKGVGEGVEGRLGDAGIVLLKQLTDAEALAKKTGVPTKVMNGLCQKAQLILDR